MINKYMNKQRGLLAVIMAMVMVFAGAAFVAAEVSAVGEGDPEESSSGSVVVDTPAEEDYVIDDWAELEKALTDAGGSYELGASITVGTLTKNVVVTSTVVIDMKGYSITKDDETENNCRIEIKRAPSATNAGKLTIKDSTSTEAKSSILTWNTNDAATGVFKLFEGSYLELNGITFVTTGTGVFADGNASSLVIKNSTITAGAYAVGTNNLLGENDIFTIKVDNSTLDAETAFLMNVPTASATIEDSILNGESQALFVRVGTVTAVDSSFKTTATETFDGVWGQGNDAPVSAVLVGDGGEGYAGNAKVSISGGSIESISTSEGALIVATYADVDTSYDLSIGTTSATEIKTTGDCVSIKGLKSSNSMSEENVIGLNFSKGSVVMSNNATFENGKLVVNSGEFEINTDVLEAISVEIADNAKIIVGDGVTLVISDLTMGDDSQITGDTNGNGTGTVAVPVGTDSTDITEVTIVSNTQYTDSFGMSKDLESDYTVKTSAFLENNLTIPEGITLTISGKLDLNGKELTVKGTLVVENNGYITSMDGGKIAIGPKGTIVNDGIIGKDGAVMVHLIGDEGNMVSVEDAIGLGFGQIKKVSGDEVSYKLSISGDVKKKADAQPTITIIGNVTVVDTLSIGNGVTLTVDDGATLTVSKNALLEITSKGQIDNNSTGAGAGKVALASGSEVVLDGESNVIFTAETGKYLTSGDKLLSTTALTTVNAKGLVLTVKSTSQYDDELEADVTEVRFIVAGTLDAAKAEGDFNADGTPNVMFGLEVSGTLIDDEDAIGEYVGIYVDDVLTIGKDIILLEFGRNTTVTVNGTVTYAGMMIDEVLEELGNAVIGAYYAVEATSAEGAKTTTHYIMSFDAAFAAIDTAVDKTITVYGDVEIASDMTVLADQVIEGAATYTIDEEAVLTLENDSEFNAGSIIVKGTFVVKVDATCDEDVIEYNAMSKDPETGDVTYYGFLAALNNAKEGDVIEISERTEVEDSFTIPAGVTIKVLDDGELIAEKNLNVAGTLINEGKVSVAGETTVSGNVDLTEGTSATFTKDVTVTGEIVMNGKYNGTNMNGAYYVNDDGEYVYTTPAKAVEGISGKDVGRDITIVGEVSDSTALALDNMTLRIEGEVELGDVTISKSKVVIGAGPFSGTIIGNYGAEETTGAVNDVVVILKDAQYMDIENSSKANAENVKVWSTTIDSTNDNILSGEVVVDKGVLTVKGELKVNDIKGTETKVNTITVSKDAGLLVPKDSTLTVNYNKDKALLTVDGTLDIDGTFNIFGDVVINGSMDVTPGKNLTPTVTIDKIVGQSATETVIGNLIITGDLIIGESEDYTAPAFTIKGILTIGDKPTSIGTTGSLAGPVDNDGGYIVAYDGADLSAAKIDWNNDKSNAKSTTFNINGQPYMTVYTDANVMYDAVLVSAGIELAGYTITDITDVAKWFTDADLTKVAANNKIGTDENLYFKAVPKIVVFQVSVGTGISLYIDDVKVITTAPLAVGTHSISAVVDPGYKGEVTISFNGVAVTDGKIVVTPEMTSASYDGLTVISATGEITADSGTVIVEPSGENDGMELTDILLIVLVVLIVIMAIIVALRMMRS